nr:hypothetical protein [Tanacetum cinerariifolium]
MFNNMCFFPYGLLVPKILRTLMMTLPLKLRSLSLKTKREAKGKSHVELSTGFRNLSEEFKDFSDNSINEDNAASTPVLAIGPTLGESLYVDPSQYSDDPNMTALEDITYFDDEKDVGAEADFTNLETTITEEGIDYKEFFAPVARIEAIRLFLAYASFIGFMVYQMDVKSAFLYGTIEKEVYVDDIIFCSTNKDLCKAFEKLMKDKFQMSSMCELTLFLGLQVKQKRDGIFISEDKYVAEILRKFGLTDGKSASTPIDTENPLLKDPDGEVVDVHTYRLISWQCKKQTVVATSSTKA